MLWRVQIRQMAPPGNLWMDCQEPGDEDLRFVKVQLRSGHMHQQVVKVKMAFPVDAPSSPLLARAYLTILALACTARHINLATCNRWSTSQLWFLVSSSLKFLQQSRT